MDFHRLWLTYTQLYNIQWSNSIWTKVPLVDTIFMQHMQAILFTQKHFMDIYIKMCYIMDICKLECPYIIVFNNIYF